MITLHAILNGIRVGRLIASALIGLFLWTTPVTAAPPPAPEGKRFLFIIDTSASMKPMVDPLSEALFDLIYSGVRGKMTNGDSYGIWLVNEQNDTSFKMEIWKERYAVEMAAKAAKHVKDKGFRGRLNMAATMADAAAVIRNVQDLTVILISNGETPMVGTPFDDIINVRFRELAPHMKKAKATINTAFVAQEGRLVAWAINSPEFLIDVPYVAPRPKPQPTPPTNTPAVAAAAPAPDKSQPAPPRVASNPIIITRDTVAKEKRYYQSLASTAVDAPESTNTAATTATNAPATNAVASAPASAAAPVPPTTNTVVTPAPAAVVVGNAETVQLPAANPEPAAAPASDHASSPLLWAAGGAAVAVVCIFIGFLFVRSRRPHPSLISESIAQQRVRTV